MKIFLCIIHKISIIKQVLSIFLQNFFYGFQYYKSFRMDDKNGII